VGRKGRKRSGGEKYLGGVIRQKGEGFEWRGTIRGFGRKSLYAATVGEARVKVKALVARLGGSLALDEIPSLGDYLEDRVQRDASDLRITTIELYEHWLRIIRGDEIADVPLDVLTPHDFDLFFERLRVRKPGLRPTWRKVYSFIAGALRQAVLQRVIAHHPLDGVRMPAKIDKNAPPKKSSKRVLTSEEVGKLLDAVAGTAYEVLFVLIVNTGLRRGELAGLQWSDIDWRNRVLTVERQIDGKKRLAIPKTPAAVRRIQLDAETIAAFRRRRKICTEQAKARVARRGDESAVHRRVVQQAYRERKRAEAGTTKSERRPRMSAKDFPGEVPWIFAGADGAQPDPRNLLRRVYQATLADLKIDSRRMHDLRHTFSTIAIEEGIDPKTVSRRMGHTTTRMTLDTYVTTSVGADKALGKRVSTVLAAAKSKAQKERQARESGKNSPNAVGNLGRRGARPKQ
jgi:integrase